MQEILGRGRAPDRAKLLKVSAFDEASSLQSACRERSGGAPVLVEREAIEVFACAERRYQTAAVSSGVTMVER